MSEQQEDKQAWVWYDRVTLQLKHVSFNLNGHQGNDLEKMPMHYDSALDIANGKSRLFEYELVDAQGELTVRYKRHKIPFKKFWQLVDLNIENKFDGYFNDAESARSPVQISDLSPAGFTVGVRDMVRNIVFYITMKNDPNYLIKKIDLYPLAEDAASTTGIFVPVDLDEPYSIYVKYDEVRYDAT